MLVRSLDTLRAASPSQSQAHRCPLSRLSVQARAQSDFGRSTPMRLERHVATSSTRRPKASSTTRGPRHWGPFQAWKYFSFHLAPHKGPSASLKPKVYFSRLLTVSVSLTNLLVCRSLAACHSPLAPSEPLSSGLCPSLTPQTWPSSGPEGPQACPQLALLCRSIVA